MRAKPIRWEPSLNAARAEIKPSVLAHLSDAERARALDTAIESWSRRLEDDSERAAIVMIAALRAFYAEAAPALREAAMSRSIGAETCGRILARAEGEAARAADVTMGRLRR